LSRARSRKAFSRGEICNKSPKNKLTKKKRFVPFQTTKNRREVNTRKIERLRMTRLY
jgi:hypothetical protein